MDNMKFRDAHAHMAELQRTADDIRLARAVRRAEAEAADGPAPPGPAVEPGEGDAAAIAGSRARRTCAQTRPA